MAKAIGLAPPSVTALADRLTARGLVHRIADPKDWRRILVALSEKAVEVAKEIYGPIEEAGVRMLEHFSETEKQIVLRFLIEAIGMQERELERLQQREKSRSWRAEATRKSFRVVAHVRPLNLRRRLLISISIVPICRTDSLLPSNSCCRSS